MYSNISILPVLFSLLIPIFSTLCKSQSCYKNSRPEVLCWKGVLRNFTKFAGKHL